MDEDFAEAGAADAGDDDAIVDDLALGEDDIEGDQEITQVCCDHGFFWCYCECC